MKKIWAKVLCSWTLLTLAACGRPTSSGLEAIRTDDGTGEGFVEVIGYEGIPADRRYYITAGQNLHVVYDCATHPEILSLLDSASDKKIDEKSLDAILAAGSFVRRADLSCKGKFLPRNPAKVEYDRTLYFADNKYYFTTGAAGEYYSVSATNAHCVYDFAAKSFGFEQRADVLDYSQPADATKTIDLKCMDNGKGRYDLFLFKPVAGMSIPFKQVLILSYEDKLPDGSTVNTLIPIHKIDGAYFDSTTEARTKLIDFLKATFKVGDPKTFSMISLFNLSDRLMYDVCQNTCANFTPQHQILTKTDNRIGLKEMPAAKALAIPDLKGQQIVQWQVDSLNSMQLVGCESDLLPRMGIKGSDNTWFATLRQQALGQLKVSGSLFQCPKAAQPNRCEKVLDRGLYTSSEFTRFLEDASGCVGTTQLRVRIDSDVVIEGTDPVRLASNVPFSSISFEPLVSADRRRLTFRYLCASKAACQPAGSLSEMRAIAVSNAKTLEFRNVDFGAAINSQNFLADNESSTIRFVAVEASNAAKVHFYNSQIPRADYKGRNLWTIGVRTSLPLLDDNGAIKERGRVNCQTCSVETEGVAIDSSDSLILVNGDEKHMLSSQTTAPLLLKGQSEAVLVKSNLAGDSLLSLGASAKAFGHSLKLNLTGDTRDHAVVAFRFLTQRFTEAFTLDLQASQIHGLPAQQVSAFRLANFAQTDGTATLNMGAIQFYRNQQDAEGNWKEVNLPTDQLDFFLKCEGRGRILYRFRNYCQEG